MAEVRHEEVLTVLAGVLGLPVREYRDSFDFTDAVHAHFWETVMADLRPQVEAEMRRELDNYRGMLRVFLDRQIAEQLSSETGTLAVEQARDAIVRRLKDDRKLWREYDRRTPPKRRWWQRRERKTAKPGMSGVG